MPNYYNAYPNGWQFGAYPNYTGNVLPQNNGAQYMINVDGEMAARAWQMPTNLAPNTIIPLWDFDGQHVYFKSIDAYGRMNPLKRGRIVFEDDQQNLMQGSVSGDPNKELVDMSKYVTKEDLDSLKQEIRLMLHNSQRSKNQNGSINDAGNAQRGENR